MPSERVMAEVVLHGHAPLGLRPEAAADLGDLHQHARRWAVQEISNLLISCREAMRGPQLWRRICQLACRQPCA